MSRQRAGIAIVAALGGIVVIGALIAGVFFVSSQESQISGGTLVHERAFRAAELGLNTALKDWENSAMFELPTGAMDTMTYSGTDWVDTVVITKVTPHTFSLVSSATAGSGRLARSRKRTLLSVRLSSPDFNFFGALTVRGATTITGNSTIQGEDTNPSTWPDCPATGDSSLAGIATADPSQVSEGGSSTITGSPPIDSVAAAGDTTNYFVFGDETWATLTATATKVFTFSGNKTLSDIDPVVTGDGVCDTSEETNWGSPVRPNPCEAYFPVIHARNPNGVLKLTGNMGQGILLVDGDLEISGNFEFYGPVIVRGRVKSTGTGGKLNGGVMAANVDIDETVVSGNSTITYSSCAVQKAVGASASPRRIVERAWTEVH